MDYEWLFSLVDASDGIGDLPTSSPPDLLGLLILEITETYPSITKTNEHIILALSHLSCSRKELFTLLYTAGTLSGNSEERQASLLEWIADQIIDPPIQQT